MDELATASLALGFTYGLRHALEADHVIAVSTIVSEHKSLWRSSLVGTFWGLGHTASLFGVGVIVLLLKVKVSESAAPWMEMPVAVMLVALGAYTFWQALTDRQLSLHTHAHAHDGEGEHRHLHLHAASATDDAPHDHRHKSFRIGKKPFLVGLVHGFAGSAALMLAVLTTMPSVAFGLAYIAVFGIGSVGGMLLMSAVVSLPFLATGGRFASVNKAIRLLAGLVSVAFGLLLAWELLGETVLRK